MLKSQSIFTHKA